MPSLGFLQKLEQTHDESMAIDLVVGLGFDRVREIDAEAAEWLAMNGERS